MLENEIYKISPGRGETKGE